MKNRWLFGLVFGSLVVGIVLAALPARATPGLQTTSRSFDSDDPAETPARRVEDGFHLLVGTTDEVLVAADGLEIAKCLTGSWDICEKLKQIKPEIKIVCRSLFTQDGMTDGPIYSFEWWHPDVYWAKLRPYLPSTDLCDYYEYLNEVTPPDWAVRAAFEIALLDLLARDGRCGLFGAFNLGTPDFLAWDDLVEVLRWIDAHPCGTWPDGSPKYHGLALHQTGVMPDWIETQPDSFIHNPYIAHRHELVADYLRTHHGYALEAFKGPIYVTEMGWEGYTSPKEYFTCEQVAAGLVATRELYESTDLVDGYMMWNFGSMAPQWYDAMPCLPVLLPVIEG